MFRRGLFRSAVAVVVVGAAVSGLSGCTKNLTLPNPDTWQVVDKTDKMSGEKSFEADANLTSDIGEEFSVSAQCAPAVITFTLTDYTKDAAFLSSEAQGVKVHSLRVRLDQGEVRSAVSDATTRNQASVIFYDQAALDQATSESKNSFAGMLASFAVDLTLKNYAAGQISELRGASKLRVEVPFTDSRHAVMDIDLKDPGLQSFFQRCDQTAARQARPAPAPAAESSTDAASGAVSDAPGSSSPSN